MTTSGSLHDEAREADGAIWWTFERQSRAGHALTGTAGDGVDGGVLAVAVGQGLRRRRRGDGFVPSPLRLR